MIHGEDWVDVRHGVYGRYHGTRSIAEDIQAILKGVNKSPRRGTRGLSDGNTGRN